MDIIRYMDTMDILGYYKIFGMFLNFLRQLELN